MRVLTVLLALSLCVPVASAGEGEGAVLREDASWRFFRGSEFPGEGWFAPGFDDSSWESGPGGIGYGDGDDRTVLEDMRCELTEPVEPVEGEAERACAAGGYLAYFARSEFVAPEIPEGQRLHARVSFDDGFSLWINGEPVARVNLPEGPIGIDTAATSIVGDAPREPDAIVPIPAELLVDGPNLIAASVHNHALTSSDASFILCLLVGTPEQPDDPDPSCEERCEDHAREVRAHCLEEGLGEEDCNA